MEKFQISNFGIADQGGGVDEIVFRNRETAELEVEQVYGEGFLRWVYGNPLGKIALWGLVKRGIFSNWYGWRMDLEGSAKKIRPFVEEYGLDEGDFEKEVGEFGSFNEFFFRKLRDGVRPIAETEVVLPADGRHLGFGRLGDEQRVFVKGQRWEVGELLGSPELGERYSGGSLLLSRLCPVDYHRFHFPCDGVPGEARLVKGPLFSVSPIALRKKLSYLWENKRMVTELVTENLGTVMCVEVGATCVGSIEQTFEPGVRVKKGDEKGYFAFGGSSTILVFEPGVVEFERDLLEAGEEGVEIYAKMGAACGGRPAAEL